MAFSMIASKKAAPVAALKIRKLAFNDARALQAASVQSIRSFNTNAREVETLDDGSKLGCRSDRRVARDNEVPDSFRSALGLSNQMDYLNRTKSYTFAAVEPDDFPRPTRAGQYEIHYGNRVEIRMDMPGLAKEHVKLSRKQNTLIIEGHGEEEIGEEEGARRYYERIDFPGGYGYKLNEIEAEMKNGILYIVVLSTKEEAMKDVFLINVK